LVPPIAEIDRLADPDCIDALAPLFEGAPRFLARLCAARPFGEAEALFARARAIARTMPEPEQVELIDAHPRLGAAPGAVSALSFREQGYDHEPGGAAEKERAAADEVASDADAAAEAERARVAAELDRLNAAYEARFGFRYCVHVAGRSHAALLPAMEAALAGDRDSEIGRALGAVVDIAADRWRTLGGR
jgi:2-oxo-4-hydroxy-4-carboxy-5-ureidoimidazoline decarboxylase